MSEEVLDWKEAMARVLNKRELYVKLLGKFVDTEVGSPARVEQALSGGNADEARSIVHTTKGAAANLGAKALAAAALDLEEVIKGGGDSGPALQRFSGVMNDTLAAMKAFMTP